MQEIIEKEEGLYMDEILLLNNIAQRFRKKRFEAGAINFSSQEVRFKLDEKGKPIGIVVKESKEAHQLIEEFMLLANRYVAEYVSKIKVNKKPFHFHTVYMIFLMKKSYYLSWPLQESSGISSIHHRRKKLLHHSIHAERCAGKTGAACAGATGYSHHGKSNLYY